MPQMLIGSRIKGGRSLPNEHSPLGKWVMVGAHGIKIIREEENIQIGSSDLLYEKVPGNKVVVQLLGERISYLHCNKILCLASGFLVL